MNVKQQRKINIKVESLSFLNSLDLADLCNITEQAIKAGGGFGWLKVPTRNTLNKYWKGIVLIKNKKLIALIIETNSMSEEFGYSREIIHKNLESNGLILVDYDPFKRKITKKTNFLMSDDNTSPSSIYVRDIDKIQNLVSNAKPIKIHTAYDINV